MVKIAVVTCAYKRPEIFDLFLQSFINNKSSKGVKLSLFVVGSSNEDEGVCKAVFKKYNEGVWVEHKNLPLGNKWNRVVEVALNYSWDYLLIAGSDDLFNNNMFKVYLEKIEEGYDYIGVKDFYLFDTFKKTLKYWPGYSMERAGESIGAGRLLKRSIVENLHPLWQGELNKSLDASMSKRLKLASHKPIVLRALDHDIVVLDVKSETNIWKYDKFPGEEIHKEYLLKMGFPKRLYDNILTV